MDVFEVYWFDRRPTWRDSPFQSRFHGYVCLVGESTTNKKRTLGGNLAPNLPLEMAGSIADMMSSYESPSLRLPA